MPKFRNNIDLQSNQLVNGVFHKSAIAPLSPVEGMVYYNTTDKKAYIYNGTLWVLACVVPADYDPAGTGNTEATAHVSLHESTYRHTTLRLENRQFLFQLYNPVAATGFHIVRLYEGYSMVRIDSHIISGLSVTFNIEHRASINVTGTSLTPVSMISTGLGSSTTSFSNPTLTAGNWLYIYVAAVTGTVGYFWLTITCALR